MSDHLQGLVLLVYINLGNNNDVSRLVNGMSETLLWSKFVQH